MPDTAASRRPRCETARRLLAHDVPDRVPEQPPKRPNVNLDAFRNWKPEYQDLALEIVRKRQDHPWHPFYCPRPSCDGKPHDCGDGWDFRHGRGNQRPPVGSDWDTWLMLAGRGGGKTRTGAEMAHRMAKRVPRMRLIAPTGPDLRETIVEGESGVLVTAPPDFMPEWEPSRKKLTWPNGAVAFGFSGEEPDRLRGPQSYWDWIDEPAHMPSIQDVWDNMMFGLRLGRRPWVMGTTTPKPSKWLKDMMKDLTVRVTRFSTYENIDNLAPAFKRRILAKYEGTSLGKQELHAEVLEQAEGALWKLAMFQYLDSVKGINFVRIIVAIDPAGTANKRSDETGIVVIGITDYQEIVVLEDRTGKYSPSGWATEAVRVYKKWSADALVAEDNYGGDMVQEVLQKNGARNIRIVRINSRRGKELRAEPVVALYEKEGVKHLRGATVEIEEEMTGWVPGKGPSPNRVDATVHGITELARGLVPAEVSDPTTLSEHVPTINTPVISGGPRSFRDLIAVGALGG